MVHCLPPSGFSILSGFCIPWPFGCRYPVESASGNKSHGCPVSTIELVPTPHNTCNSVTDSPSKATKQDTSVVSLLGTKVWSGDPVPNSFPPACWQQLAHQGLLLLGIHVHGVHVDDTVALHRCKVPFGPSLSLPSWPSLLRLEHGFQLSELAVYRRV